MIFDIVTTEPQTNAHFVFADMHVRTTTISALLIQASQRGAFVTERERQPVPRCLPPALGRLNYKRDACSRSAVLETIAPLPSLRASTCGQVAVLVAARV